MTDTFNAPHAVIIGAGPGIGASVARKFAGEGFALTLVARDTDRLNELAGSLREGGSSVEVRAGDAADPSAFGEAIRTIPAADVLVYNAAMLVPTSLLTVTSEKLLEGYAVDVVGAVTAAQVFLPAMQAARGGTVIFTSGSAGIRPSPGIATVSMGKAALRSAATMLAGAVAEDGVHVVSVPVSGAVKAGTAFDPAFIAELYWELHLQPRAEWADEVPFDGR